MTAYHCYRASSSVDCIYLVYVSAVFDRPHRHFGFLMLAVIFLIDMREHCIIICDADI